MHSNHNPKNQGAFRLFITLAAIIVFVLTNNFKVVSAINKATKKIEAVGPAFVKNGLTQNGVFNTPAYRFTNVYDQFKRYPNLKGLFIKGLTYHGKATEVFCWYGVPESLKTGEKAPAVVLVHGGGGTLFPEWIKKWNDRGYIAISIALEGQVPGPRDITVKFEMNWPTTESSGPFRHGFFQDVMTDKLSDQWFFHAVADVILANSLIRSFPEVDTTKIGITGISWGGILTNVITGIDNRFSFAIPVYGCGYLQETPLYTQQLKLLTPEAQKFYLENWEPSLYIPFQKQPTLFVDGTNDLHFTMNSFTKTYAASTNEKYLRIELNMPHGHGPGWAPEEIYSFADYITRGSAKPPVFKLKETESKRTPVYQFTGKIKEAFLLYTTDTSDWGSKNYHWDKIAAEISESGSTITGTLPDNALYYFINAVTNNGLMFSSPMQKNKKP